MNLANVEGQIAEIRRIQDELFAITDKTYSESGEPIPNQLSADDLKRLRELTIRAREISKSLG